MLDEINFELLDFFPLDKVFWQAGTYDQYLFDLHKTVNDNLEKGNYQVAYFYSHLIFMCYVYYCIEKAYQISPDRIKDVYYPINAYANRKDKPNIESYNSIYDFSKIPEKEIFKIFYVLDMDHEKVRNLSNYISERDDFAHASGKGNISFEEYDSNKINIVGNMSELHKLFEKHISNQYMQFLLNSFSMEYAELQETFEEYIYDNDYSLVDLQYICYIGISSFRNTDDQFKGNYRHIKKIHCAFIEYCTENYTLLEPNTYSALKDDAYLRYRYKDNATAYIESELNISEYECAKDGGDFPLFECPSCWEEQLVYDREKEEYICFSCDATYEDSRISNCCECGTLLVDDDDLICSECWRKKMEG